ncbi:MAG: formylmethanofuran dehydrogenase [Anaerolineae bacterium]|nr:formylmethanofuran dehydrogenase [Anaerolineae bacterium]
MPLKQNTYHTSTFDELLRESAAQHRHLCPRQVIGVRMGMYAANLLQVPCPQQIKRLFTFVETDGCFADGVAVATGCTLGHRTLRLIDFGKIAATFVDTMTEQAIRIYPALDSRQQAKALMPEARSRWHAQLAAYQIVPDERLFQIQHVSLSLSMKALISRPGVRVNCAVCGEEIINEREILCHGLTLCRACAGESYYSVVEMADERF